MLKSNWFLGLAIAGLSLGMKVAPAYAQDWYFLVENQSSAALTDLLVSEDQKIWGRFEIGAGIASGETAKLVWDRSTNNQACVQWIKAQFSDESESVSQQFDFCSELDEPIVFSD